MGSSQEVKAALASAQELLAMAKSGLDGILSGDPRQRRPGIMNLAVYGRAVTQALQRLRSSAPGFDEWYKPLQDKMANDELMAFFNKLRNAVLKQAELATRNVTEVGYMDGAVMARLKANPPPNAEAFFLGDTLGGNGWVVRMPDGSTEHVYVELPEDVDIESRLELVDAPAEHDGSPIPDASVETVGRVYFDALSGMVREAVERFGQ